MPYKVCLEMFGEAPSITTVANEAEAYAMLDLLIKGAKERDYQVTWVARRAGRIRRVRMSRPDGKATVISLEHEDSSAA
uniref:Uncharacterized protein n=1 Tax=viral metagenome TaxID=1070528 RepID=A0A6M3LBG1_9ZZZZ